MSDTAEYPRQLYHPDGRTMRVATEEDEQEAGQGWQRAPSAVHQTPRNIVTASGDDAIPIMLRDIRTLLAGGVPLAGGNDALATTIRDVLERVLDERGVGTRPTEKEPPPEDRPLLPPRRKTQE